jgi:hypothetical protein
MLKELWRYLQCLKETENETEAKQQLIVHRHVEGGNSLSHTQKYPNEVGFCLKKSELVFTA